MKAVGRVALALAISLKGCGCLAQRTADVLSLAINWTSAHNLNISELEKPSPATDFVVPVPAPASERTVNSEFVLLNAIHLGMAIFDVEMTQRCISNHHCRETNPLMPSSHAAQLSLNLAYVAGGTGISYWLKRGGSKLWRVPPIAGAAIHSGGVATGFEHH